MRPGPQDPSPAGHGPWIVGPWIHGPSPRPGPPGARPRPPLPRQEEARFGEAPIEESPLEGASPPHEDSWEPLRALPRAVSPAERALGWGLLAAAAVDLGIPLLLRGPTSDGPGWTDGYLQAMHNTGWRSTFALMAALSGLRGGP